jgi:hypothetical protein
MPDEQAWHGEVHIHCSQGCRKGDCAGKAAGITPGDLGLLSWQHDRGSRKATRAQGRSQQKSAEGIVVAQAAKAGTNWSGA